MRFLSLVKAVFSQDMNLFNFRVNKNRKLWQRLLLPCVLVAVIMLCVGYYAFNLIEFLSALGSPDLILVILSVLLSVFSLLEGIYKVQGILFECKDNDLLFSLPVSRYKIFALRVFKLLSFQIAFNALFAVPVLAAYAVALNPAPIFYLAAVMMLILLPLIPTAIAVVLGYLIKSASIKFRHQKFFQIILTFAALGLVFFAMSSWEGIKAEFAGSSLVVSETASQVYYPAGAFARLAREFNLSDFLGVIASSIVPLLIVIYLCSIRYFQVISKSSSFLELNKNTKISVHASGTTFALIKKEISRIFSSPVLVVNSLVSPVLLIIFVVLASFNSESIAGIFAAESEAAMALFYVGAVIIMAATTCVTSSLISLEGKSFNITKSLPITAGQILTGKLLASLAVSLPLFLLADLIFIIRFSLPINLALGVIILPALVLTCSGLAGLLANLKYPKMDFASETEVVKQSASSFIAVLTGMISGVGAVALLIVISIFTSLDAVLIIVALYLILDFILYRALSTWDTKKLRQIEA